jgi:hypothetical protein
MSDDEGETFNVVEFYDDGTHLYIARFVSAKKAFDEFMQCIAEAEELPVALRVIITDGWDMTNAEWKLGEGLTYPKPEETSDDRHH